MSYAREYNLTDGDTVYAEQYIGELDNLYDAINAVDTAKLDASEVATSGASKVLRLNSSGQGGIDITGNAATATTGPATSWGFYYPAHEDDGPFTGTFIERDEHDTDNCVWLSVGPTGSGADIIWTELDAVPAGAKAIKITALIKLTAKDLNASGSAHLFIRPVGSTKDVGAATIYPIVATEAKGQYTRDCNSNTVDVKLDANKKFELQWWTGAAQYQDFYLYVGLEGWYK
jgi:hypothetical protein